MAIPTAKNRIRKRNAACSTGFPKSLFKLHRGRDLCKVKGEGIVIGVGNGDPNCQESDKKPERSLFNGLAQVIVQATKRPGTLTIEATSRRMEVATITLVTKEGKVRLAVPSPSRA